jgi:hypothetical protein
MVRGDLELLRRAKHLLESPGLAMRMANLVGKPIELGLKALPDKARSIVVLAAKKAMERALDASLLTMDTRVAVPPTNWLHRVAVGATGAVGGAAGWAGLPVELPISTVLMLRSIAEHARAQGEDLATPEGKLNCLMVFALGGKGSLDDDAEEGYFAIRAALARAVAEAAGYLAGRAAADVAGESAAPVLARLSASLAARFTPQVADKVAAQMIPVLGSVGGASVNLLFMNHFQDVAWGHFTVRRLERVHGEKTVREIYEQCDAGST